MSDAKDVVGALAVACHIKGVRFGAESARTAEAEMRKELG